MALVTTVTSTLALTDSSGYSILPSWMQSLLSSSTTYTSRPEIFTFGATTSPTVFTVNNIAGSSPVTAYIFNNAAADATVLGVAGFTQTVRAGKYIIVDQLITTSNLTLSVASGTGDIVVILLD